MLFSAVCHKCGTPVSPGTTRAKRVCADCAKAGKRDSTRALKVARRAEGLCACGSVPAGGRKACTKCAAARNATYARCYKGNVAYLVEQSARGKKHAAELKRATFEAYGNVCVCCSECRIEFLTIDHIVPACKQGIKEGSTIRGGRGLYLWLKRNGYPADFRLLCMNCNWARGKFGYCPHEREKKHDLTVVP